MPEIPTFKEQGFDVVANEWYGLLAPAGTPKPIIEKLNTEMKRIMALPGMGDRLAAIELMTTTPEELTSYIKNGDRSLGRADPAAGVEGGIVRDEATCVDPHIDLPVFGGEGFVRI